MPFLVDSIIAELNRVERNIHLIIHPVVAVVRDKNGKRKAVVPRSDVAASKGLVESYMHFEIDRETEQADLDALTHCITVILDDVRVAVADWQTMRQRLTESLAEIERAKAPIPKDDVEESKEFLKWLGDENFIFLGYRQYRFVREEGNEFLKVQPETGLGILRDVRSESRKRSDVPFTPEFSRFAKSRSRP